MDFYVYYRCWPHKSLRCVKAVAEDQAAACADVAEMLKEDKEIFHKPLIAMILGGKV
jgi:hypothetical protein